MLVPLSPFTIVGGYLLLINIFTFAIFGSDKLLARSNAWRIRERTLLACVFVGGSMGALAAMKLFRHKTKKNSFQMLLAVVLLVQLAFIAGVWYYTQPTSQPAAVDEINLP